MNSRVPPQPSRRPAGDNQEEKYKNSVKVQLLPLNMHRIHPTANANANKQTSSKRQTLCDIPQSQESFIKHPTFGCIFFDGCNDCVALFVSKSVCPSFRFIRLPRAIAYGISRYLYSRATICCR